MRLVKHCSILAREAIKFLCLEILRTQLSGFSQGFLIQPDLSCLCFVQMGLTRWPPDFLPTSNIPWFCHFHFDKTVVCNWYTFFKGIKVRLWFWKYWEVFVILRLWKIFSNLKVIPFVKDKISSMLPFRKLSFNSQCSQYFLVVTYNYSLLIASLTPLFK